MTALALIHQHTHPRRSRVGNSAPLLLARLEIGLDFTINGATEAIKRIDALHGFHHTRATPYALVIGHTEYRWPA
jgi:hypothetical protein